MNTHAVHALGVTPRLQTSHPDAQEASRHAWPPQAEHVDATATASARRRPLEPWPAAAAARALTVARPEGKHLEVEAGFARGRRNGKHSAVVLVACPIKRYLFDALFLAHLRDLCSQLGCCGLHAFCARHSPHSSALARGLHRRHDLSTGSAGVSAPLRGVPATGRPERQGRATLKVELGL